MKFHFMVVHRGQFRLRSLCRVLGISRRGYYAWQARPASRREQRTEALLLQIRAAYERGRRASRPGVGIRAPCRCLTVWA